MSDESEAVTVAFAILSEIVDNEDLTGDFSDHELAATLLVDLGDDREAAHRMIRRAMRRILTRGVLAVKGDHPDPREKGQRPGSTFCPECGDHTCGIPDGPGRLTRCGHKTCPRCAESGER